MSRLRSNVEGIREASINLAEAGREMERLKNELSIIRNDVNTDWEGLSGLAFRQLLNAKISEANKLGETISELRSYADYVGNQMAFLDAILSLVDFINPLD